MGPEHIWQIQTFVSHAIMYDMHINYIIISPFVKFQDDRIMTAYAIWQDLPNEPEGELRQYEPKERQKEINFKAEPVQ